MKRGPTASGVGASVWVAGEGRKRDGGVGNILHRRGAHHADNALCEMVVDAHQAPATTHAFKCIWRPLLGIARARAVHAAVCS